MMKIRQVLLPITGLLWLWGSACSVKQHDNINDRDGATLSREAWVSKAKQVLHYGHGLSASENLAELSQGSREEILEKMFDDPRFADMVLDFNLYFMGQRLDHYFTPLKSEAGTDQVGQLDYSERALSFSNAITSARETYRSSGRGYLSLLEWKQPLYVLPNEEPVAFRDFYPENDKIPYPAELQTWNEKRRFTLQRYLNRVDAAIAHTQGLRFPEDKKEYCDFEKIQVGGFYIQMVFFSANVGSYFNFDALFGLEKLRDDYCAEDSKITDDEFPDKTLPLRNLKTKISQIIADADARDPQNYEVRSLMDIHSIEPETYGFDQHDFTLTPSFFQNFQNSSTNLNRKRAKYFLSRFFCDDLTPIGFVSPEAHATDEVHGSNPSCLSCHYKLDPMAGFFRIYGPSGRDQSRRSKITFDDGAKADFDTYMKNWGPTSSGRTANIGFIRSQSNESLNSYGSSLEDLFSIMRNAPEVRACIVKRLSQYILGEDQQVDSSFMHELTQDFIRESRADSSRAFKNVVKGLMLSKTFSRQFPDSEQCYDLPRGERSEQRPPCQIAHILQKNCVVCHSSTNGPGRLDLSRWNDFFPHLNERGQSIAPHETLSLILERISTPKKDLQMPPQRHFPNKERETLFLWLQKRLKDNK